MTAVMDGFCHQAVFYAGERDYVGQLAPFVREGVEAGEPVLVAVPGSHGDLLRDALGSAARRVVFADMAELGANPARIIPAWADFVERSGGGSRPARGIGEPVWAGRTAFELDECHLHERLINVAFAQVSGFRLLCPYDTERLAAGVVAEARRSHPSVFEPAGSRPSPGYVGDAGAAELPASVLPAPPGSAAELEFAADALVDVRAMAREVALAAGLHADAATDVALLVNELATNSVRHGGGRGLARAWQDAGTVVVEVRDRGRIQDPLVGRRRPGADPATPRGLWLVHQLADLVQVRTSDEGTVVRAHLRRR